MTCTFCGQPVRRRLTADELFSGEALCDKWCTAQHAAFWASITASTNQRREFHGPSHPRHGQEVTDFDRRFFPFDDQKG